MFKVKKGISVKIMKDIVPTNYSGYNTRSTRDNFLNPWVSTTHYGHDTLAYFGPKISEILPDFVKNSKDVGSFKTNIKSWKPSCPCRLCKFYKCFIQAGAEARWPQCDQIDSLDGFTKADNEARLASKLKCSLA